MDEYIDILDKDGNLTDKKKNKKQIHVDGDWHRAVHIWIINSKGELLIQKRSPDKDSHPNQWDISAAGHVSSGEDPITSAIREIEEEIGVKVKPEQLEKLFTLTVSSIQNNGTYFNNEFDDIFLINLELDPTKIKFQESEISEMKNIDFVELEKLLRVGDPTYVPKTEEYYDKLFKVLHTKFKK